MWLLKEVRRLSKLRLRMSRKELLGVCRICVGGKFGKTLGPRAGENYGLTRLWLDWQELVGSLKEVPKYLSTYLTAAELRLAADRSTIKGVQLPIYSRHQYTVKEYRWNYLRLGVDLLGFLYYFIEDISYLICTEIIQSTELTSNTT